MSSAKDSSARTPSRTIAQIVGNQDPSSCHVVFSRSRFSDRY
jgi:hypothetical protein